MSTNELALARELLGNEVMALRYVDIVGAGPSPFEDASAASKDLQLEEWAAARGHSISRSLMPEAFEQLPKRVLDYWSGTYIVTDAEHHSQARDGSIGEFHTLMISVRGGVSLNGIEVAAPRFQNGTLTWGDASQLSMGRLTFEELVPPDADFFQKRCRGTMSQHKGTTGNVVGTTVAVAAVMANATVTTPFDVSAWRGTYTITTGGFLTLGEGADSDHVAVTYQAGFSVDVNQQPLQGNSSTLSWDSGGTRYQVFFSKLASGYKTVIGRVYPVGGPAPEAPTFIATEEDWLNRLSPAAIATLTISAFTGAVTAVAGAVAFILNLISRRDAALNQKRKVYASEVNRQIDPRVLRSLDEEVQRAKDLLNETAVRFSIDAKKMAIFEPALTVLIRDADPRAQATRVSLQLQHESAQLTTANDALANTKQQLLELRNDLEIDQARVDQLRRELPQRKDAQAAKADLDRHLADLERRKTTQRQLLEEARIHANDVLARTERVNSISREINHGPT